MCSNLGPITGAALGQLADIAAGPIADEIFDNPEVRCINLIGGVKTARLVGERAGRTLKPTVLEFGGYNPMIILDDVDMDYAVRTAVFGSFFH